MTMVRRLFYALLILLASPVTSRAQAASSVIAQHFTTTEGLPSNDVMCALKDRDGFLWFGTWYGLCRFDGDKFLTYNKPLKAGSAIPPRKIENIAEDAQGCLWLKTVDWRVYVFNRHTEQFHAVYDELKAYTKNLQVIKIQPTSDGHILLLTKDKTLLLGNSTRKGVSISRLFDSRGQIDPQTLQLKDDIVATNGNQTFYIGRDYRLFCQSNTSRQELLTAMQQEETAQTQHEARLQQMVAEAGISKYSQLYQDRDSLLWVCSTSSGIYCISRPPRQFTLIALPDDNQTGVRCLYQLADGSILVGTRSRDAYLYTADGQLLKTLSYRQYGIGAIYHAMEDSRGRLWLSTKGDGLVLGIPDPSQPFGYQLTHFRHNPADSTSISGNNVYMTFEDSQHHLWVCTLDGGLNLIEDFSEADDPVREQPQAIRFLHKHCGFARYPVYGLYTEVRNIVEDAHGHLWVGTQNGLMSLQTGFMSPSAIDFKTYRDTPEAAFANNDIYTLYRDHKQQIWVGAFGGGLQRLTDNNGQLHFSALGPREGLRNDVIVSITEDLHNHLWFATEAGLSMFNQETGRIHNFDQYDGLPSVEMEEASFLCCTNGRMWVGTKQGLLLFHPDQLQNSTAAYPTFILELVCDNQPYIGAKALAYTDSIELNHDQNAFTIEFAALNYQNHGNVNYRYRLEGFDRDWRYSGPHPVGSYNEVPPGHYTFVVETIDVANPTLQSTARLHIRILPPWWATWWAYLIYCCIASLIAWLIIRTMLQMNRMRNEIYISQRLAKLTSKPDDGDEFIDRLHRIIRENIPNSDFNIDDLAAGMGLSRSAFYKKVKAQTGFAPVDLIKEFRLSHAAELLQTTSLNITEVALRSGFADSSYFGKCFRKRYGMSPREYIHSQQE